MSLQTKIVLGYVLGSIIALLFLGHVILKDNSKIAIANQVLVAETDTLHQYKTKDHKNAAYIQTIITSDRAQLLVVSKAKDSVAYKLLIADKRIVDLTHVKPSTRIDTTTLIDSEYFTKNGVITKPDSLVINKTINNKWFNAKIGIVNDSLSFKLITYDDLIVTHHLVSTGLFKPQNLVVYVIDQNPYSKITGLSSYEIAVPKQSRVLPFVAGAVATTLLLILLHAKL